MISNAAVLVPAELRGNQGKVVTAKPGKAQARSGLGSELSFCLIE